MKMRSPALALLLGTVAHAAQLHLSPPSLLSACHLSPERANLLLSQHLGLDFFETVDVELDSPQLSIPFGSGANFMGQGVQDALLFSIDEGHVKDVLPGELSSPFTISRHQPSSPSLPVSGLLSKYLDRARHAFTHVYASSESFIPTSPPMVLDLFTISPSDSTHLFLSDLASISSFLESTNDTPGSSKFGAFDLGTRLHAIAKEHGKHSEHYKLAASAANAVLSSALAKSATTSQSTLNLAIITYPYLQQHAHAKRNAISGDFIQPPQSPLPPNVPNAPEGSSAFASCFSSEEACTNATNSCFSHGSCVSSILTSGDACFACHCSVTTDLKGRREWWAGEACERKDISGPFVLLTGTAIATILLIVGSISLLYSIGTEELPSVLSSTAATRHHSN